MKREINSAAKCSAPKTQKKHRIDWRAMIVMSGILLLMLLIGWVSRVPGAYIDMFVRHYDGTSNVLESIPALALTEAEQEALLPLEQAVDDWREQKLSIPFPVIAEDGTTLTGDLYDAGSTVTVILLHSFDEDRNADFLIVPFFSGLGYNIFVPDLRCHGESGGELVTWGAKESRDLLAQIDALMEHYGENTQFVIWGQLLGAASALMAAPDMPDNVKLIIAESAYASFDDLMSIFVSELLHLPDFFVMPLLRAEAGRNGFHFDEADVAAAAQNLQIPVLLICGEDDQLVTEDATAKLLSSLGEQAQVLSIQGGRYGTIYTADPSRYESELSRQLAHYVTTDPEE